MTDDGLQTTPRVWHELPRGELKKYFHLSVEEAIPYERNNIRSRGFINTVEMQKPGLVIFLEHHIESTSTDIQVSPLEGFSMPQNIT